MNPIETNKALALEFLELAFANRVDDALSRLSPVATWWVLGEPDRLKVAGTKTRSQIERLLKGLERMVPGGMQMVVTGITAEGERVAVEIEAEGACANGQTYHNHYHILLKIRDGLIVSVREYMDTLHLSDVLSA
ncbi:MAG: ketosteroid isomerase-like protein [Hydrocarboniphaga sp.]|uniref:nuclear transport factor 2 family protein n=1 Tax=Hydrocarboniphaga sp. TaxID=2033016 RepID=UPI0026326CE7|nr:nuclear transport factor 2 family protein [Hydrocarboniphaga sp.]MDB5971502.1 ketosteroid isomerase-like protein [Hydrocarboniphaga sp.]